MIVVGDTVRIVVDSPAFGGREGTVVEVKARRRGPRTTEPRFDYGVRFGVGDALWFADTEVEKL